MYMVYRVSMNRAEVSRGDNIIAIYGRKAGAIHRIESVAHANPNVLFAIGWLPEGAKPNFENMTRVVETLKVEESKA